MTRCLPTVAFLLIACSTFVGSEILSAEEQTGVGHPAEIKRSLEPDEASSAFDLAVPLLNRSVPTPSYGSPGEPIEDDPVADIDKAMEMDHSMHQMPGATEGNASSDTEQ